MRARAASEAHQTTSGRQAKNALGNDWRGWWPDEDPDDGGDDTA
ncbi:hypothetical protein GHK50_21610 [Sinorhizobium medicae]|uniref:Uncharacterized protein n=1 Tax=Sinorhizobium medicae TaxID=110321 RepID=A0A6G1WIM6_9HYPH|nr:hypothetical protein [Sinorhizobium medicae]MQX85657.1 hypothetical protein [Sinorhizobium medicae]RVJ48980.1 hypothetical protein CN166_32105 [Sinorhizobium medicae]RVJ82119.1 hypothetical protein CN167_01355 [Sinorhizobium medicae]RVK07261.1 hypothetical protein CN165_33185 [Sinorhizobium medicae]